MKLHDLQPAPGSRKPRTRVGRGIAAGKGKTAGRGTKGQKARPAARIPRLVRGRPDAAPHAGSPSCAASRTAFKIEYEVVNVGAIGAARRARRVRAPRQPGTASSSVEAAPITVNQDILRAAAWSARSTAAQDPRRRRLSPPLFVVADAFTQRALEQDRGRRRHGTRPRDPDDAARRADGETADRGRPPPRPPAADRGREAPAATAATERPPAEAPARPTRPPSAEADAEPTAADAEPAAAATATDVADADEPTAAATERIRRRRLTRVRVAPQRLPRAGHPAPDPRTSSAS